MKYETRKKHLHPNYDAEIRQFFVYNSIYVTLSSSYIRVQN